MPHWAAARGPRSRALCPCLVVVWVDRGINPRSTSGWTTPCPGRLTLCGMTTFDYLLNVGLIGLVVLQLRGVRLDRRALVLPLVLVAWAASHYLRGIPTVGNDLPLVVVGTAAGIALGCLSGLLTRIHTDTNGFAVARATAGAAGLWVLGIGARMAFVLYVQHGGRPTVARFSAAHHITGQAWVSGLVLMAFAEVVSRTLLLWSRSRDIRRATRAAAAIA
jgi:hypothetical protein